MKLRDMVIGIIIFFLTGCGDIENENVGNHMVMEDSQVVEREEDTNTLTKPEPDEGFVVVDVVITNGTCYEYHVYEMENEKLEYYFEIVVLENGEELQVIRQEQQEYASLKPSITSLISEVDIDFDGNNDILIHRGNFGTQGAAMYTCYRKEGEQFVEDPAFSEIANPLISRERQLIQGSSRSSMAVYVHDMYEFVQDELVNSYRLTMDFESEIAIEEEFLNQEWVVVNEYTNWEDEIYGEDTYWSILADHWEAIGTPFPMVSPQ